MNAGVLSLFGVLDVRTQSSVTQTLLFYGLFVKCTSIYHISTECVMEGPVHTERPFVLLMLPSVTDVGIY